MSDAPAHGPAVTAGALLADPDLPLRLRLVAGQSGLARTVRHSRIQKAGLALTGHLHGIRRDRVQILGRTETTYLERLAPGARRAALEAYLALELCCLVVTEDVEPGPELSEGAESTETPLLVSSERSSVTITALHALLDERLAPRVRLHGVLVDVFGVGLLLIGASAVGKSEAALDLVMRGHRLVADDVVECAYRPPGMVFGAPVDVLRHHLEVRGLGILNIKDLFGVTATRERKRIDVVVRLVESREERDYDRLGLDDHVHEVLGVSIRELVIPVRPGRDMASILEIAARNELLRSAGHHAGRELVERIEARRLAADENESIAAPPVVPGPREALKNPESSAYPPFGGRRRS